MCPLPLSVGSCTEGGVGARCTEGGVGARCTEGGGHLACGRPQSPQEGLWGPEEGPERRGRLHHARCRGRLAPRLHLARPPYLHSCPHTLAGAGLHGHSRDKRHRVKPNSLVSRYTYLPLLTMARLPWRRCCPSWMSARCCWRSSSCDHPSCTLLPLPLLLLLLPRRAATPLACLLAAAAAVAAAARARAAHWRACRHAWQEATEPWLVARVLFAVPYGGRPMVCPRSAPVRVGSSCGW